MVWNASATFACIVDRRGLRAAISYLIVWAGNFTCRFFRHAFGRGDRREQSTRLTRSATWDIRHARNWRQNFSAIFICK